jgi:perosamine synthetase
MAVRAVMHSGSIAQGIQVCKFEKSLASYTGRKFAVAVNTGLSALHLSLIALKIREGDEVILPSYTCDALLNAVLYLNAKPVIVDVNYADGNIAYKSLRRYVKNKTKAILVPHSFGFPADMDEILKVGVPVVEDCAVSMGAKYKNKRVGGFGRIAASSFYATKMLTTGEGGVVLTDDKKAADDIKQLRDYRGNKKFAIRYNYKMTDIAAAMGMVQLDRMDEFIEARRRIAAKYSLMLNRVEGVILPGCNSFTEPVFYRYIVKLPNKDADKVITAMAKHGISCGHGVLQPLHRLLGLPTAKYPNSEKLRKESVSLPIYPSLKERDVEYIAKEFIKIAGLIRCS